METRGTLDERAFSRLYTTYFQGVVQFARGYVNDEEAAKDVAQDVFVTLWENRERVDAETPMKAYLFTLARNRALDYLKHQRVKEMNEREIREWMEHTPEDWRTIEEREERLREKMKALPGKQREAIEKCMMEGKTYQGAAEEMDISVNSLKTHLARGLAFLRAEMAGEDEGEEKWDVVALLVLLRKA